MRPNKQWSRNLLQETGILSMHPTQCVYICVCAHIYIYMSPSVCLPVHLAIHSTNISPSSSSFLAAGSIQRGGGMIASLGRRLFQELPGCLFGLEFSHAKRRAALLPDGPETKGMAF